MPERPVCRTGPYRNLLRPSLSCGMNGAGFVLSFPDHQRLAAPVVRKNTVLRCGDLSLNGVQIGGEVLVGALCVVDQSLAAGVVPFLQVVAPLVHAWQRR